ncbi:MAG: FKBP-type peptidyl-prolyl cis-trans isomerase [Gammaproteobacteria bacterium]|nr:FKBP-type peptidyl-prolyl cis-trans isomerase [Gammaproteobacteria bacterium]
MKTLNRATSIVLLLIALLVGSKTLAQDEPNLDSEDSRVAYSLGANIGQNLLSQGLLDGVDEGIFMAGMLDAFTDDLMLEPAEMMEAIQGFMQRQQAAAEAAVAGNLAASEAFLADNAQNDGVITLDSGLQYMILESGPAVGDSPTTSSSVLAHYHGTLTDGSVFDSSVERGEPATFGVSQVIAGWTEALQLMKVGDKWRLFIPPAMAYGEASPTPAIPPNSALIFEVELLEIR